MKKSPLWILIVALLAGCDDGGGGSDDSGHDTIEDGSSTDGSNGNGIGDGTGTVFRTVTGTVAIGKPVTNATITAKCEDGSGFRDPVTSGPDGSFSGEIAEEATPCALQSSAGKPAGALHSLVEYPIGTTNITPLTDLAIALASSKDPSNWFAQSGETFANTANALDSEVSTLLFALEHEGFQFPVDEADDLTPTDTDIDPFNDPFSIGDRVDQVLDELQVAIDDDSNIADYAALVDIVKGGNLDQIPSAPAETGPIIVTDASRVPDPDDAELTVTEAAIEANQRSGRDVIQFDASLAGQTIETGSIGIASPVTLRGPEERRITLSGIHSSPLIRVFDNDSEKSVSMTARIENLTLTNVGDILGGCIHNQEGLELVNVTITECEATTGAGIVNDGGILTVRDSVIADNQADARKAGGILNKTKRWKDELEPDGSVTTFPPSVGRVTLVNTAVTGNQGSGIVNGDEMTIRRSRIANNEAEGPGGGIFQAVGASGGSLEIVNSVIENNLAESGAGINGNGPMTLVNSTVVNNQAVLDRTPTGVTEAGSGGGILAAERVVLNNTSVVNNRASHSVGGVWVLGTGEAEILNSTVAANEADTRGDFENDNLPGEPIANLRSPSATTTIGNVILSDAKGGSNITQSEPAFGGIKGQVVIEGGLPSGPDPKVKQANPQLEPLSDEGGTVPVRRPGSGSVAIDLGRKAGMPSDITDLDGDGNETEAIPFDTRGQGFGRVAGGSVDAGAIERNAGGD